MAAKRERSDEGKESERDLWNSKCQILGADDEEFDDEAEDDWKGAEGKESDFADVYRDAGEESLEDDRTRSINLQALQRRKEERERAQAEMAKMKEDRDAAAAKWKGKSRIDSYHI